MKMFPAEAVSHPTLFIRSSKNDQTPNAVILGIRHKTWTYSAKQPRPKDCRTAGNHPACKKRLQTELKALLRAKIDLTNCYYFYSNLCTLVKREEHKKLKK